MIAELPEPLSRKNRHSSSAAAIRRASSLLTKARLH